VLLVGQYRYVFGLLLGDSHRRSGGGRRPSSTRSGASWRRKTGYLARHVDKVCTFQSSKSVLAEIAHVYIATGLVAAPWPAARGRDGTRSRTRSPSSPSCTRAPSREIAVCDTEPRPGSAGAVASVGSGHA
jgi:hypothetical protein